MTTVPINRLHEAFPIAMRPLVERVSYGTTGGLRSLNVDFRTNPGRVQVEGESVRVLQRSLFVPDSPRYSATTDSLVMACIASRNLDGRVREGAIPRIVGSEEPWAMPFILELAADYVVEIVGELDRCIRGTELAPLRDYVAQNPAHWAVTAERILSYWNEYYAISSRAAEASTYPGFRFLDAISGSGA